MSQERRNEQPVRHLQRVSRHASAEWPALVAPEVVSSALAKMLNEEARKIVDKPDARQIFARNAITHGALTPQVAQPVYFHLAWPNGAGKTTLYRTAVTEKD